MQVEMQDNQELSFPNAVKVSEYLRRQGYKVSQRKCYGDIEKGLLVAMPDGSFTMAGVEHYIKLARLKRPAEKGATASKVVEALKLEELRIAKLKRQALERQAAREAKQYIKRSDHNRNAAARAAVMDQGMQNFIRVRIPEIVAMVGGDPSKASIAIDIMTEHWHELLLEYRDLNNLQFIVEED